MAFMKKFLRKLSLSKAPQATISSQPDAETASEYIIRPQGLKYRPLDESKAEIRLLKINRAVEGSRVDCTLWHVSCAETWPDYKALSYCWGDTKDNVDVIVNNWTVPVTRNLEAALRELYNRDVESLWVDALCINQKDQDERGHQILRMKNIYSRASETVAWLGPDKDGYAETAFACMRLLETRKPEAEFAEVVGSIKKRARTETNRPAQLVAVRQMIRLPYWKRTWVIQELALSVFVDFYWGKSTMDAYTFISGIETYARSKNSTGNFNGWRQIQGIMHAMIAFNPDKDDSKPKGMSLEIALGSTALSQATDLRDKVFGIIGLCSNGSTLLPSPDYHGSLELLLRQLRINELRQFVPAAKGATHPMDLICLDYPRWPKKSVVPSWVTDWQAVWDSESANVFYSALDRGMNAAYRACGSSEQTVTISDNGLVLTVRGYLFDSIEQLSPRSPRRDASQSPYPSVVDASTAAPRFGDNPYTNVAKTYEAIWRTLMMDRLWMCTSRVSADFGLHFASLYTQDGEQLLAQRSFVVRYAIDSVRDFLIHGRRFAEWAELSPALLVDEDERETTKEAKSDIISRNKRDTASENSQNPGRRSNAGNMTLDGFVKEIKFGSTASRLMTTAKGYIGLSHCQAIVGDLVCLLQGCTLPTILRPCEGGYTVVGESYVHGIMDGEFWNVQDESTMQDFHLH